MNEERDFVEALRDGGGYDWLCLNGTKLSKEFLIDVLKEFIYVTKGDSIHGEAADSIEDNCLTDFFD